MSDRESWLPSDEEIATALPNRSLYEGYGEEFDPEELHDPIRNLIRSAVEKAVAEERARHAREIKKARLETERHVLSRFGYFGKGCDGNDIRIREINIALAALEDQKRVESVTISEKAMQLATDFQYARERHRFPPGTRKEALLLAVHFERSRAALEEGK